MGFSVHHANDTCTFEGTEETYPLKIRDIISIQWDLMEDSKMRKISFKNLQMKSIVCKEIVETFVDSSSVSRLQFEGVKILGNQQDIQTFVQKRLPDLLNNKEFDLVITGDVSSSLTLEKKGKVLESKKPPAVRSPGSWGFGLFGLGGVGPVRPAVHQRPRDRELREVVSQGGGFIFPDETTGLLTQKPTGKRR